MALLLKLLLNYWFKICGNFMVFYYHLVEIETSNLFQKFGKISLRFLVFLSTYLYFFTQKQIVKMRLLIKRQRNIFTPLLTINKMTRQINYLLQNLHQPITNLFLPNYLCFLFQKTYIFVQVLILLIFQISQPANKSLKKNYKYFGSYVINIEIRKIIIN